MKPSRTLLTKEKNELLEEFADCRRLDKVLADIDVNLCRLPNVYGNNIRNRTGVFKILITKSFSSFEI